MYGKPPFRIPFSCPCVCCVVACLLGLAASLLNAAERSSRPNILFIYTDDHSYRTVRCYPESYPWVRTPNIDALAKAGVRFERAYLGSWCMPSRASLLTGLHPHSIQSMRMEGTYPGSAYDPVQCPFWPANFRKHGYQTAQIGKWHTGIDTGPGRDWDYQVVWNRPKHPDNAGNYYDKQILSTNGGPDTLTEGYSTDNYTKLACDYIRGAHREHDSPWYLWLCYGGVHGPSHPAPRHKGAYKDADVETPADIFAPRPGKPSYLELTQAWAKGPGGIPVMGKSGEAFGDESAKNPKTFASWVQQVNECVLSLDEGVGELMKTLKETGQLENTLVVFTADQGFSMGQHGFRTKLAPYDANYASPLIISQPGTIPQGKYCPQTVNAPDLVATFHARAGIEQPWKMPGRDISPLLADPDAAWPHATLYEHMGHHYGSDVTQVLKEGGKEAVHNNVPWYVVLREGRYKLIRYLQPGIADELYDLKADPEELTNLFGQPEHAKRVADLRNKLNAELRRSGADFVDLTPQPPAN